MIHLEEGQGCARQRVCPVRNTRVHAQPSQEVQMRETSSPRERLYGPIGHARQRTSNPYLPETNFVIFTLYNDNDGIT